MQQMLRMDKYIKNEVIKMMKIRGKFTYGMTDLIWFLLTYIMSMPSLFWDCFYTCMVTLG